MTKNERILSSNLLMTGHTTPEQKIEAFLLNPSVNTLLTLEEYESLSPYKKGYVSYLQSSWPESELPEDVNPFGEDTTGYHQFNDGAFHAMIDVQDSVE